MKYIIAITSVGILATALSFVVRRQPPLPLQLASSSKLANTKNGEKYAHDDEIRKRIEVLVDKAQFKKAIELQKILLGEIKTPMRYFELARIYEAEGDKRSAWKAYGCVLHAVPGASSSFESDPVFLVRYGSLCKEFGSESESKAAYRRAAGSFPNAHGTEGEPEQLPGNASDMLVQSRAYYMASLETHTSNPSDSLWYAGMGLAISPGDPLMRYGYAEALYVNGQLDSSRDQYWQGQNGREGAIAELCRLRLKEHGWLNESTSVIVEPDHTVKVSQNAYRPSEPVRSPSISDLVSSEPNGRKAYMRP